MPFYRRESNALIPTDSCIGPWSAELQHGGPPSALLGGAAERFGEDADAFLVTRVTVEILRPIGLIPLHVAVTPIRLGRKAQWLTATLTGGGKELARANVVRIRRQSLDLPQMPVTPEPAPAARDALHPFTFPFFRSKVGYHTAVDLRVRHGEWGQPANTVWIRPTEALVEGEASSALERTLIVVDASNGVAPSLPFDRFTFVNPDLTLHLRRHPVGEWLCIDARSISEPSGVGLVEANLFDRDGQLGRCQQSLVVSEV